MLNSQTINSLFDAAAAQAVDIITETEVRILFSDHGKDPFDYLASNHGCCYTIESVLTSIGY